MELNKQIQQFMDTKPETISIIGYGSMVKQQIGNIDEGRQVDIIATTENDLEWHKKNYKLSKKDYFSFSCFLLPAFHSFVTDINYLSNINFNNTSFKLGIINEDALIKDLLEWDNMFMAGRFQKSNQLVKSSSELEKAIQINKLNALKFAIIMADKEEISIEELLKIICSISYYHDIRTILKFENPHKIDDIVTSSYEELKADYFGLEHSFIGIDNEKLFINKNELAYRLRYDCDLPKAFLEYLLSRNKSYLLLKSNPDNFEQLKNEIITFIGKKNFVASIAQPLKGVLINSPVKSYQYLKRKRSKNINSK